MSSYVNQENHDPESNHNCVSTSPQPSIASSYFNSNATRHQFNDLDDNELQLVVSLWVNAMKVGGLPYVNQNEQHAKQVEQIRCAGLSLFLTDPKTNSSQH
jgi:hypothetical protein